MEATPINPIEAISVVVLLLVLGVGLFSVLTVDGIQNTVSPSSTNTTLSLTDQNHDITFNLPYFPKSKPVVKQFNLGTWKTIDSSYVTWSYGSGSVTVLKGGFYQE